MAITTVIIIITSRIRVIIIVAEMNEQYIIFMVIRTFQFVWLLSVDFVAIAMKSRLMKKKKTRDEVNWRDRKEILKNGTMNCYLVLRIHSDYIDWVKTCLVIN